MQVTVRGEQKQINVQTITLHPEDGNNLYGFHCLNCGNFYQKVGGKVSKIYPTYELSDQVPVIGKCRNCSKEIMFQTHDGYSPSRVNVTLRATDDENEFYCWKGKDKILEYSPTSIYSFVYNSQVVLPLESRCVNANCDAVYFFRELL